MNAVTQHFFASSETVSTASSDLFAGFRWLLAPLPQAPEERAFAWTVRQLDPDEGRQARSIRAAKQPRRA